MSTAWPVGSENPNPTTSVPMPAQEPESYMEMTDDVRELLKENQRRER